MEPDFPIRWEIWYRGSRWTSTSLSRQDSSCRQPSESDGFAYRCRDNDQALFAVQSPP